MFMYWFCYVILLCTEFSHAGVDLNKPIIATCGSGVTACWIAFAASLLGKDIPVYDVSLIITFSIASGVFLSFFLSTSSCIILLVVIQ